MGARVRALGPRALVGARVRALGPWALVGARVRALGPRVLVGAVVAGVVLSPAIASACAVCTAGRDEENQLAFLLSTLGMSLMPLIAIGTLVFVLWRRIQKLEVETETARTAPQIDSRQSRL